jgi:hypothetical protein
VNHYQSAGRVISGTRIAEYPVSNAAFFTRGYAKEVSEMIRKLASGEYRLYARKKDKTGKRCNHKFGTFKTRAAAEQHERVIQYFKRRF